MTNENTSLWVFDYCPSKDKEALSFVYKRKFFGYTKGYERKFYQEEKNERNKNDAFVSCFILKFVDFFLYHVFFSAQSCCHSYSNRQHS